MMAGVVDTWQADEQDYCAFLLRCWQESDPTSEGEPDEPPKWRFTLVHLQDDKKRGFACTNDLVAFLSREFGQTNLPIHSEDKS